MIDGIRQDMQILINNYRSGDWDTYWMTALVVISCYAIYFMFTMPC